MSHVLEAFLRLPPLLALVLVFLLPALEASAFVGVVVPNLAPAADRSQGSSRRSTALVQATSNAPVSIA